MATKRVLVVDDQTPVRELVAAVLAADGHAVETARDGADALRVLDGHGAFDLIVSDLKMPGLDGPSLYLELTRRWPDTRPHLLFISGFVESPEYAGCRTGGERAGAAQAVRGRRPLPRRLRHPRRPLKRPVCGSARPFLSGRRPSACGR